MRELPILMSTEMVKANLTGIKTETRRIVKGTALEWLAPSMFLPEYVASQENNLCPYGKPGDLLWVRELLHQSGELGLEYTADREVIDEAIIPNDYGPYGGKYTFRNIPNIHMPKWAARIWLQVEVIYIERLHDITEVSAIAEGVIKDCDYGTTGYRNYLKPNETVSDIDAVSSYQTLWQSINGINSWDLNPWVWVVKYRILSTTGRPVRACRVCGCTEDNCIQCIKKTGMPCYWVEYDLCSACMPIKKSPRNLNQLLHE